MGDNGEFDIDVQDGSDLGEWVLNEDGTWQVCGDCCEDAECPCPAAYPCGGLLVADSFGAILSGITLCTTGECVYLSGPEWSIKFKSVSLLEAGDCLEQEVPDGDESCLWGDEYPTGTATNLGYVVADAWSNSTCNGSPDVADGQFEIYGELTVDYNTMTARLRAWIEPLTVPLVLFDGTVAVDSACEDMSIDNGLEVGDCDAAGTWVGGENLGYGGAVAITRCCLE